MPFRHQFIRPNPHEIILLKGVMALAMGIWLLTPFGDIGGNPFKLLTSLGISEEPLGVWLVFLSVTVLLALWLDSWVWLRLLSLALGLTFALLTGSALVSTPTALAVPVYGTLTAFTLWATWGLERPGRGG